MVSLLFSYLLTTLFHSIGCLPSKAIRHRKQCRPLIAEILDIQVQRDELMDQMNAHSQALKEGLLSRQEHLELFTEWQESESSLGGHVTQLYDQAYANGCM